MNKKPSKPKKFFNSEFKTQAIELAKELGVRKASEKLGMPAHQTLAAWVRFDKKLSSDKDFRLSEELKVELKKVKKELDESRKINAILKDAAAFFCRENVK